MARRRTSINTYLLNNCTTGGRVFGELEQVLVQAGEFLAEDIPGFLEPLAAENSP